MSSLPLPIKIGTRASKLALIQAEEIKNLLSKNFPTLSFQIVPITTSGDKILDRNLSEIGGKGLFIKELEESLIQNKIDIAVHCAKDLTPIIDDKTQIAAFTKRLDHRDCLVSKKFNSISQLPQNAVIGTSSVRRKAILLSIRSDLKIINFRGNVDTRLAKIDREEADGAILAACGLERLGRKSEIKEIFSDEIILPSAGQGSIALQIRKNNQEILDITKTLDDEKTRICIKSERAFVRELGASCTTPVGAYASFENGSINLKTAIFDYDGKEIFKTNSRDVFDLKNGIELGVKAAQLTKAEGYELLKKICL